MSMQEGSSDEDSPVVCVYKYITRLGGCISNIRSVSVLLDLRWNKQRKKSSTLCITFCIFLKGNVTCVEHLRLVVK